MDQGLYFLRNAIGETIPDIYDDVRRGLRAYYGTSGDIPVFLRYRSWIGSDRDGNPNVTADVTRRTFAKQRLTAINIFYEELVELRRELSVSSRQVSVPRAPVRGDLRPMQRIIDLDEKVKRIYRHEPYRLKISYMMRSACSGSRSKCRPSWIRMHNPGPGRKRAVLAATTGRLLSRTWICSANVLSGRATKPTPKPVPYSAFSSGRARSDFIWRRSTYDSTAAYTSRP